MTTWLVVIIVLVIVAVIAILRERNRVGAVEQWASANGLQRVFPVPAAGPEPAATLVRAMTIHGGRTWGTVLEGTLDGVTITIAEHESSVPGRKTGIWHTVISWPLQRPSGRIVMARGRGPQAIATAVETLTAPLAAAVGLSDPNAMNRNETPGGWSVIGEPLERERWLTPDKVRELDAWPHGGTFVRDGASGAWRVQELISTDALARWRTQLAAARQLLE